MSEFAPRGTLSVSFGEACDRGKVREENQDSIRSASIPLGDVFIVADGIGGYQGGATASRMVVDGFHTQLALRPAGYAPEKALAEACSYTNVSIHTAANSGDPATQRMGSTVVLTLIQAGNPAGGNSGTLQSFTPTAWIGHVGDSRAYLIRGGKMSKITSDHSAVQALINRNLITEEEARNHPDASVLTRSLGHRPEVEIEIDRVPIQGGDALLLCSDGLWGYVSDGDIAAVATDPSLSVQTIADTLLHQALAAGGQDNIGIEFIRIGGDASLTLPELPPVGPIAPRTTTPIATGWKAEPDADPPQPGSNRHIHLIIAAGLLLLAAGGYLAIAHHNHRWPFSAATDPKVAPVVGSNTIPRSGPIQTPSQGGNAAQRKPRPASGHPGEAESPASKDPVAQNQAPGQANQADHPDDTNATATPGVPSSGSEKNKSRGPKRIGVFGDLPPGKHIPPANGEMDYRVFTIKREENPHCSDFAGPTTRVYTHEKGLVGLILKHRPDIRLPGSGKDVETDEIDDKVKAACGADYDVIVVMPEKPGATH
jgi:serine/threonine protein phosphatase PrpC